MAQDSMNQRASSFSDEVCGETNGCPGSGLGLAIVRDIADLYEGSIISLDPSPAGGMRACLDLPGDRGPETEEDIRSHPGVT